MRDSWLGLPRPTQNPRGRTRVQWSGRTRPSPARWASFRAAAAVASPCTADLWPGHVRSALSRPNLHFPSPTRWKRPPPLSMAEPASLPGIVKNYTGDVMNFEMAAELCQARHIEVQAVVIDDDVAVQGQSTTPPSARRRRHRPGRKESSAPPPHPAATRSLGRVRRVNAGARSMHGLEPAPVPAAGKVQLRARRWASAPSFGPHHMPLMRATIARVRRAILADAPHSAPAMPCSTRPMGGTPLLELYLTGELEQHLRGRQIAVTRRIVATTSPPSTWPAAESPCCRPTTSCCPCGTTRC